jgi:hypothetical protein
MILNIFCVDGYGEELLPKIEKIHNEITELIETAIMEEFIAKE